MNIGSGAEAPKDVPEADALEQQIPVLPEGSEGPGPGVLPDDAPEPDVIDQHTDVLPGRTGIPWPARTTGVEAAEADLLEQAVGPSYDDDENYPEARQDEL